MAAAAHPIRWPSEWRDPGALSVLQGTPFNYLLMEENPALAAVASKAREHDIQVAQAAPEAIVSIKGLWPGIRMSQSSNPDAAKAGPTGEAWVNTNGWRIRLAAALHPGSSIWVDAAPPADTALLTEAYLIAIADAAMYGGRWITSLDHQLAAGIAAQKAEALHTWREMIRTIAFFSAHESWWSDYIPKAVVGVLSEFAGKNATFSHEALNLLGRTNTQYRIVLTEQLKNGSLAGLKALVCLDPNPPAGASLQSILAFVERGGVLIAGPAWGQLPGSPDQWSDNPRYMARSFGKGRMAFANSPLTDPYLFANDAVVLISHRYDLLRFWNAGAVGSFLTERPDRERAVVQMLFFAKELNGRVTPGQGPDTASVRVTGRYRTASLSGPDRSGDEPIETAATQDAVELHLPSIAQYAAVELEV